MIGERIKRARTAIGLSLRGLGEKLELSQTAISKFEKGELTPSSKQLYQIGKILGVRTEYFFRQSIKFTDIDYRKRSNTPKKLLDRIHGDILNQLELWFELLDFFPDSPTGDFNEAKNIGFDVFHEEEVSLCADRLREYWELGSNAIPDLIDTLESKGICVITTDVDNQAKFDGMTTYVNNIPVIVISSKWTGDRQRFTLAHELGHILLNIADNLNEEKICNRFAGSFLLPDKTVITIFGIKRDNFELQELLIVKHEYGISMQAILYRALQCGILSQYHHQGFMRYFSKMKWRKNEPGDPYQAEKTDFFNRLVYRAIGQEFISESKAAELMQTPLSVFHKERMVEQWTQ
ncbi:MAG: XRE family transcriptional regulator [gamma proteobacterium symbiont of Taylorina sp.]|nr:XRE family transcriptional regulator [gamma proteobacterium symbiont of Taylorina sp.]